MNEQRPVPAGGSSRRDEPGAGRPAAGAPEPSRGVLEWRAAQGGERLDKALTAAFPQLSRTQVQRLIEAGQITLDGRPVKASYKPAPGDLIVVRVPPPAPAAVAAEEIPLAIVYEDDDLLVVDKPAGMVVHPATSGHMTGTLVNAVLAHVPLLEGIGGERRPGIVHRLDKGTSGLIAVAKHDRAMRALQAQFKARQVHKLYLALVDGAVEPARGRIEIPIDRDPRQRQRMAAVAGGRPAVTLYRTLETFGGGHVYTLLACEPRTGRTHQIRVHLAALGTPIVGDVTYRRHKTPLDLDRPFLHAHRLGFRHPSTGEPLEFEAPLPHELEEVLAGLRARRGR